MQVHGALANASASASASGAATAIAAVRNLYRFEGLRGFYRGFGAVAAGAVPAQATYFAAYEFGKSVVPRNAGVAGDMATGCIAQLIAGVAFTPVDILKERLQVKTMMNPAQRGPGGAWTTASALLRSNGPLGLFRGYWLTNCVWLPWNVIYIAMYESLKRGTRKELALQETDPIPAAWTSTIAFAAASTAAVLTHPPDVIKTRIQVLSQDGSQRSARNVLRRLLQDEGWRGLWAGVGPRVLTIGPGAALSWMLYEQIKGILGDGK